MRFEKLSWLDDLIGGPVCRLLVPKRRSPASNTELAPPAHALLVKLRGIGDIILALPMLQALKERGTRITFVCGPENRDWLAQQKTIDDLLVIDFHRVWRSPQLFSLFRRIRALQVDACIDLTQSAHFSAILGFISRAKIRVGFENKNDKKRNKNRMYTHLIPFSGREHMAACFFDLLTPFAMCRPEPLRLLAPSFSDSDRDHISDFLHRQGCAAGGLVGIHASGAVPAKLWPLAGWVEVCADLIRRGYTIIAVGGSGETEANRAHRRRCRSGAAALRQRGRPADIVPVVRPAAAPEILCRQRRRSHAYRRGNRTPDPGTFRSGSPAPIFPAQRFQPGTVRRRKLRLFALQQTLRRVLADMHPAGLSGRHHSGAGAPRHR